MYDILDYFMIPDVIFDVKMSSYPFKKSKCQNSDTKIGCPSKETHLYPFWDQHSHLIEISGVLGDYWTILGHFGGSMTSQKGSRFYNFKFLTSSSVFLLQNTYPCTFLGSKNHFIEFSGILGDFGTILGHFGGPWRHKRGQYFTILNFWLHHRSSYPKILILAHF